MYDFTGKVAIVTGASSGIGQATVELLLQLGAQVLATDIAEQALLTNKQALDPAGERLACMAYDASSSAGAQAVVEQCLAQFGAIDFLVLSAGIYRKAALADIDDDGWRRMLGVNLDGIFFLARAAVPHMRDGGAIVNIASIAAHQGGTAGNAHYGASKGGVLAFTRGLAREIAPRLRANCVSPGWIETAMVSQALAEGGDKLLSAIPLRRAGQPREIATIAAFLCSDASSFVTGEAIIATGGAFMG